MPNLLARLAGCVIAASLSIAINAPAQARAPLPGKSIDILALARQKNGLDGADVHPWHAHGKFTLYDDKGNVEQSGVYEEWWAAPGKYKRSFSGPKMNQTDYVNGAHLSRDGDQNWQPKLELLRENLLAPVLDDATLKQFDLSKEALTVNGVQLECVSLFYGLPPWWTGTLPKDYYPTFCVSKDLPALRIFSINPGLRFTFGNYALFQGHYVAREIRAVAKGKLRAELAIDVLEALPPAANLLEVPPSAVLIDLNHLSLPTAMWPEALKRYPPDFMFNYLPDDDTKFKIQAVIEKDGTLGDLQYDGPPHVRKPAMDAIGRWVYRPITIAGEPRTVHIVLDMKRTTEIRVDPNPQGVGDQW